MTAARRTDMASVIRDANRVTVGLAGCPRAPVTTVSVQLVPDVWAALVAYAKRERQEPGVIVAEAVRAYLGVAE